MKRKNLALALFMIVLGVLLCGLAYAGPKRAPIKAKEILPVVKLGPLYALCGARPVELIRTADGGLDVLAFDWELRMMSRDMSLLLRLVGPEEDACEPVTAAEFGDELRKLQKR